MGNKRNLKFTLNYKPYEN